MGGCWSAGHDRASVRGDSTDGGTGSMPLGRNQPLKPESPKWKSDVPLTDGQLRSKRDEFWETAPAYEGRREIWDALKGAAQAMESGDHTLAQAIIDGANITCPNGMLTDCYDELGNRYVLPVYCLNQPVNMVEAESESDLTQDETQPMGGVETTIKLRVSTGKDVKMTVRSTETVHQVKKRLNTQLGLDPSGQRWYFSGKLLTDKIKMEEIKIPKGYVIQVIVSDTSPTPVDG